MERPKKKEIKIKCLQGQMKEGEKEIDCSSYPRGMKHEVLSHYQNGYMRGLSIGVDQSCDDWEKYLDEEIQCPECGANRYQRHYIKCSERNSLPSEEEIVDITRHTLWVMFPDNTCFSTRAVKGIAKAIHKRILYKKMV